MAGGTGSRMNSSIPKQFLSLNGVPILIHTLRVFEQCPSIDAICLACSSSHLSMIKKLIAEYHLKKVRFFANAGADRRLSSKNAVDAIAPYCSSEDIVLIHDAVRPFLTQRIVEENIEAAKKYGAVYTVYPTQDTIVQSLDEKQLHDIPVRSTLFLGQTPQSFQFSVIEKAHHSYELQESPDPVTDDCTLAMKIGYPVHLVRGSKWNIKITTPEDMEIAQFFSKLFMNS